VKIKLLSLLYESEGRGANFNSNDSEKDELQGRIMKGDVRRSEESLISFFAGPVLNKYRIVKTTVLESYLTCKRKILSMCS
jgi:hypothetical protein